MSSVVFLHIVAGWPCGMAVNIHAGATWRLPSTRLPADLSCPLHGKACTPPKPISLVEAMTGLPPVLQPDIKPGI